jgi:hypothetical protein
VDADKIWIVPGVVAIGPETGLPRRCWHKLHDQQGDLGEGMLTLLPPGTSVLVQVGSMLL